MLPKFFLWMSGFLCSCSLVFCSPISDQVSCDFFVLDRLLVVRWICRIRAFAGHRLVCQVTISTGWLVEIVHFQDLLVLSELNELCLADVVAWFERTSKVLVFVLLGLSGTSQSHARPVLSKGTLVQVSLNLP